MTKAQIYILSFLALMIAVALYWMSAFNTSKRLYEDLDVPAAQYKDILSRLPGQYSNAVQYQLADPLHKEVTARRAGEAWMDLQDVTVQAVDLPTYDGDVFVVQWRDGGAGGRIGRQQIWALHFKDDLITMDIILSPPDLNPENVTVEDIGPAPENCTLPLRVVDGEYHFSRPQSCTVPAANGEILRLTGEVTLYDALSYQESALSADGTLLYEIPGNGRYDLVRTEARAD